MRLKQMDKQHTPHLFYSTQDIDGNWVETEFFDVEGALNLRKRCVGGWQQLNLGAGAFYLYFIPEMQVIEADGSSVTVPNEANMSLVADGFLNPQKYNKETSEWVSMVFTVDQMSLDLSEDNDYEATALYYNDENAVQIDIAWRIQNSKQRYRISGAVGDIVRLGAIVEDHQVEGIEVKQSIEDFLGFALTETDTNEENGAAVTYYLFESDGFEITAENPVFEVDPYLELEEETDHVDVFCDGYYFRVYNGNVNTQSDWARVYFIDGQISAYVTLNTHLQESSWFYFGYDDERILTILEDTPTRIKLRIDGNLDSTSGTNNSYLTDSDSFSIILTILPDRIFIEFIWVLSDSVTISSGTFNAVLNMGLSNAFYMTNEDVVYENDPNESSASDGTDYNTVNYLAVLSDECNHMGITIDADNDSDWIQRAASNYSYYLGWRNTTLNSGTHKATICLIIDSAEREGVFNYPQTDIGTYSCEDDAANSTISSETGTDASLSSGNTSTYQTGRGIDTQGSIWIDLPSSVYDNDFLKKGSILINFEAQFAYDTAMQQNLFGIRFDGNNRIFGFYNTVNDDFQVYFIWGATTLSLQMTYGEDSTLLNGDRTLFLAWDSDNDFCLAQILGKERLIGSNTGTPTTSNPTTIQVGAYNGTVGDYLIKDIKTFSDCILPADLRLQQGTQYKTPVLPEYSDDVTLYIDCSQTNGEAVNIGTGNVTVSGASIVSGSYGDGYEFDATGEHIYIPVSNVPTDKGVIAFSYKNTNTVSANARFFANASTAFTLTYASSTQLNFYINGTTVALSGLNTDVADGNENHIKLFYDTDNNETKLEINGVLEASSTQSITAPTLSGNLYIGNQETGTGRCIFGIVDEFFITNDPSKPYLYKPEQGLWVPDTAIRKYEGGGLNKDGAWHSERESTAVTLNESTPNVWDAITGAEASSNQDDTTYAASERINIAGAEAHWYIGRWDIFGSGTNQIPVGTTAEQIEDATLTLTLYGSRAGETGDVLQVSAVTELFAWKDSSGNPIIDSSPSDDGVSFLSRNDGSTEKQSIAAGTSWTAGNLDDSLAGSNTITFGDAGWTTSAVTLDVTDMVKYWCNNPDSSDGFAVTLTTAGGSSFEFYHFDGTTPPSIDINYKLPEIKFTVDIPRHKMNHVIHDFQFVDKDGTDYLVGHYKMEESSGTSAIDEKGNANGTYYNTPTFNGKSVSFDQANSEYLDLSSLISSLDDETQFTVLIWFTPEFDYNTAADQELLSISNGDEYLQIYYSQSVDYFRVRAVCVADSTSDYISGLATNTTGYPNNAVLQSEMLLTVLFDVANNNIKARINDREFITLTSVDMWDEADPLSVIRICRNSFSNYGSYEIHDVKILDGKVLDHGAFFTGNNASQLALAHKDILTYWKCDSTTLDIYNSTDGSTVNNSGGTFETGVDGNGITLADPDQCYITLSDGNGIDFNQGSLGFWYINQTTLNSWSGFFQAGTAYAQFALAILSGSADQLNLYFGGTTFGINYTGVRDWLADGNPHFIEMRWSVPDGWIDVLAEGILLERNEATLTKPVMTGSNFYIGCSNYTTESCEGTIDEFYITSSPNTPQIPTVNGKPLQIPIIDRS